MILAASSSELHFTSCGLNLLRTCTYDIVKTGRDHQALSNDGLTVEFDIGSKELCDFRILLFRKQLLASS